MLILQRGAGEKIYIGEQVEILVCHAPVPVKLGVTAPVDWLITRWPPAVHRGVLQTPPGYRLERLLRDLGLLALEGGELGRRAAALLPAATALRSVAPPTPEAAA